MHPTTGKMLRKLPVEDRLGALYRPERLARLKKRPAGSELSYPTHTFYALFQRFDDVWTYEFGHHGRPLVLRKMGEIIWEGYRQEDLRICPMKDESEVAECLKRLNTRRTT